MNAKLSDALKSTLSLRLCFGIVIVTMLTERLLGADLMLSSILGDRRLWPSQVQLTRPTTMKLLSASGQEIGSMQGPAGRTFNVVGIYPNGVLVQMGAGVAVVDAAGTDVLQRAEAISEHIASSSASVTPVAAAAVPVAPPAAASASPPSQAALAATPAGKVIDFRQGWAMPRGRWKTVGDTEISQSDPRDYASNAYIPYPQKGKMEYRVTYNYRHGKDAAITTYIFCSDGAQGDRGTSYMITDSKSEMDIVRFDDNKRHDLAKLQPIDLVANNEWIDAVIVYDANTGKFDITRNGKFVGTCTDPDPIKEGKDFSIGTCATPGSYKDIQIRSLD